MHTDVGFVLRAVLSSAPVGDPSPVVGSGTVVSNSRVDRGFMSGLGDQKLGDARRDL